MMSVYIQMNMLVWLKWGCRSMCTTQNALRIETTSHLHSSVMANRPGSVCATAAGAEGPAKTCDDRWI
ncbi:hypothetical protein GLOTRDRAFT_100709, partial [Gloeophyllum trabeum ATCC 11539]